MLRVIFNTTIFLIIISLSFFLYLSFVGIETNKFNRQFDDLVNQQKNLRLNTQNLYIKFDLPRKSFFIQN